MSDIYKDLVNRIADIPDIADINMDRLDDLYLHRHKDPYFFESCMIELSALLHANDSTDFTRIRALAHDPRGYMHACMTSYFKSLAHEYTLLKATVRIFAPRRLKKRVWRGMRQTSIPTMSDLLAQLKEHIYASDFARSRALLASFATCVMELHSLIADVSASCDVCDVGNALFLITNPVEYFQSQDEERAATDAVSA